PQSRRIEIVSSAVRDFVQVDIRDHGVGLDAVDMRRLFTLCYTNKASGTGIGLSVSRSIIEAHGGRPWGEENPGGGAMFSVSVPVHLHSRRPTDRPHAVEEDRPSVFS